MAQNDYVARSRSKKQTPPPHRTSLPWLRIVITLLLVAVFSYFLWTIDGTADKNTSNDSANTEQTRKKKDTLPDTPEEE